MLNHRFRAHDRLDLQIFRDANHEMSGFRNLSIPVGVHKLVRAILSATQFAFRMSPVALFGQRSTPPVVLSQRMRYWEIIA